ncbi:MAG: hypothetical protein ACOCQG_06460 [Candidatus Nanoarchaeia archaeon]
MKIVKVKLSRDASKTYEYIKKNKKVIHQSFIRKKELVKQNIHYGDPIAKSKFPKRYKTQYKITNLFRAEIADFWRFLYTLTQGKSQDEIIVFILDITSHKKYNKIFGYRNLIIAESYSKDAYFLQITGKI